MGSCKNACWLVVLLCGCSSPGPKPGVHGPEPYRTQYENYFNGASAKTGWAKPESANITTTPGDHKNGKYWVSLNKASGNWVAGVSGGSKENWNCCLTVDPVSGGVYAEIIEHEVWEYFSLYYAGGSHDQSLLRYMSQACRSTWR